MTPIGRAVVGGCALGFATGWNIANTGSVAGQLAGAYGVGLAAIGLFTTALFITHAGMQIPAGRAADRFGARRTGMVALLVILTFNVAALAVVASLVASAFVRQRNLARAALSLGLLGLATYQARHTTLAVVVGAVLMHAEVDDLCAEAGAPSGPPWPRLWAALALAPGLALAIGLWWRADRHRDWVEWIAPEIGDGGFARLAEELPSGANVYAPFQSSGLLLWLAAPRGVQVFFDSRNDCYDADVAEAAFALEREDTRSSVSAILDRYSTAFVLVPTSHPVYRALAGDAGWSIWRNAGQWAGFERRR